MRERVEVEGETLGAAKEMRRSSELLALVHRKVLMKLKPMQRQGDGRCRNGGGSACMAGWRVEQWV